MTFSAAIFWDLVFSSLNSIRWKTMRVTVGIWIRIFVVKFQAVLGQSIQSIRSVQFPFQQTVIKGCNLGSVCWNAKLIHRKTWQSSTCQVSSTPLLPLMETGDHLYNDITQNKDKKLSYRRETARQLHVFLGPLTDCALHWASHLFLQRVSIACHDRFCPTVRPSDRLTVWHTLVSCQNDSSYDHAVFTGG